MHPNIQNAQASQHL